MIFAIFVFFVGVTTGVVGETAASTAAAADQAQSMVVSDKV